LRAVGLWDTPDPQGQKSSVTARSNPTGALVPNQRRNSFAVPWLKGQSCTPEDQLQFNAAVVRELNLSIASVVDAGGGNQSYPQTVRSSMNSIEINPTVRGCL